MVNMLSLLWIFEQGDSSVHLTTNLHHDEHGTLYNKPAYDMKHPRVRHSCEALPVQSQTAVTAYFSSKQLLLFVFA